MKVCFVFAMQLAVLVFAVPARAGDTPLTAELSQCQPKMGAVLVSPDPPHQKIAVYCLTELKAMDCQILSHIRNYIFYSYGICENTSDMFSQILARPSCSHLSDLSAHNNSVYDAIPDEVWSFFRTIRKIQSDKKCLSNNLTTDY